MLRFALDEAAQHARSALAISQRLGLAKVRAIVLLFLGEIHALRRENSDMERFLALADSAAPGDPEIEGSAWAGGRGMRGLLDDDWARALEDLGHGIAILDVLPQQGPASYRGLWPLLLAAAGDPARRGGDHGGAPDGRDRQPGQPRPARVREAILAGRAGVAACCRNWPGLQTVSSSTIRSGPPLEAVRGGAPLADGGGASGGSRPGPSAR